MGAGAVPPGCGAGEPRRDVEGERRCVEGLFVPGEGSERGARPSFLWSRSSCGRLGVSVGVCNLQARYTVCITYVLRM